MCLQEDLAYREGVYLLGFSVNRLQQGEVAGDATLSHGEKRIVIVQEEMELGILGLQLKQTNKQKTIINSYIALRFQLLNASN